MNPTASLARQFAWSEVAAAIGSSLDQHGCTPCPLCTDGYLSRYCDDLLKVDWLHCHACKFSGDVIALCCHMWNAPAEAVIDRLQSSGVRPWGSWPDQSRIEAYERDHLRQESRIVEFWSKALDRRRRNYSKALEHIDWQLGIYPVQACESRLPEERRLVGAATIDEVEDLFHPRSSQATERLNHNGRVSLRRGSGAGGRRIFKGEGWEEVLVLPFHDLPGRISGFLFVGRNADRSAGDFVFKAINRGPSNRPIKDAGIAMRQALTGPPKQPFGDTIFLVPDPKIALQLQSRYLRSFRQLLPLGVVWSDGKHRSLAPGRGLFGPRPIFWAPSADWDLLAMARSANGFIATGAPLGDRDGSRSSYFRWLPAIKKCAIPWKTVLCNDLQTRPIDESVQMLEYLGIRPGELQRLVGDASHKGPLQPLFERLSPQRSVGVRGQLIVETDDGWYSQRGNVQICNGKVEVDELLGCRSIPDQLVGSVQIGEERTRFQVSKPDVRRRGLFACVKEVVPDFRYRKGWSVQGEFLSYSLHLPRLRQNADVVGWHDPRFWFPQFSILNGGKILPETVLVNDLPTPAMNLAQPESLSTSELKLLSRTDPANQLFWATTACIALNICSFRWHRHGQPFGIGLVGAAAQHAGLEAARLMGCIEFQVPVGQRRSWIEKRLEQECNRHHWPLILMPPQASRSQVATRWVAAGTPRNCIIPIEREDELPFGHELHLVRSEYPITGLSHLDQVGPKVLPGYLQSVCYRHGSVFSKSICPLINTLYDLAEWFRNAGGDRRAVLRAASLLQTPDSSEAIAALAVAATKRRRRSASIRDRMTAEA